ncbi:MAG: hypothetical protein IPL53_07560 [Ignavibacteria bacterium]|nr:hypothetical protein [Ignavibacteria bacterium]
MKALKLFTGILIMMSLAVLSSCSDSITSSLNSESDKTKLSESINKKGTDSFSGSFDIKPGESVLLDREITALKYITEYSISNCADRKKILHISASNIDGLNSLPCESEDYLLHDLLIENISDQVRTVEVKFSGLSGK